MKSFHSNKILIGLAVLILLIFLHNLRILTPITDGLQYLFRPAQQGIYFLGEKTKEMYRKSIFFSLKKKKDLVDENLYLTSQIEELKVENINLNLLKEENNDLKELLNFDKSSKYSYIPATVIAKGEANSNILIINRGESDGIFVSLAVVNQKGMVIGKIIKTTAFSSQILLLNDNQSRIAGSLMDHLETNGVVEGKFGLSMHMNKIPQNILINKGGVIITSGLEPNIPYGLIIGEVNEIEKSEGDLFQSANIQPLSPLDSVRIVAIILPSAQN